MKTKFISVVVVLLIGSSAFGQLVRTKSSKSVDVHQGFNLNGFNTSANFGYFFTNKIKASAGLGFERKNYEFSRLNRLYFDASSYLTVYQFSSKAFLDVKASFYWGLESSQHPLFGDYKKLFVGEGIGLRFEYMFLHYLSFSLFAEQNFWQLSEPGSLSWRSGFMISYNL